MKRNWLGTLLRVRIGLGKDVRSLDSFARFYGEIEELFSLTPRLCCATVRHGRIPVIMLIPPLLLNWAPLKCKRLSQEIPFKHLTLY
jgi:hypothetical protein